MLHSARRSFDPLWFKLVSRVGNAHVVGTLSAIFISVILCLAPPAWGQVITGDLTGQVTDATGAVIPNATIVIVNTGTGSRRTLKSNESGEFIAAQLQLGTYTVEVSAAGFQRTTLTSITVSAGDRLRISPKLNVGSSNETVQVDANTSGTLQTDNSTDSTTIQAEAGPMIAGNLPPSRQTANRRLQITLRLTVWT